MSLESTINATSSRESAAGPWPCGGPALKACPESGQAPAHANRSVAPGEEREPKTNATFGQSSETSSELAGLPLFSGSRSHPLPLSERLGRALARRLARFGSMEFEATWSQRATPLGLRYWAHIPLARRTGGSGCTGWPTASARDWKDTPGMATECVNPDGTTRRRLDMLPRVAQLAAWPTPQANKNTKNSKDPQRMKEDGAQTCLADAAHLAGWATPKCADGRGDPYDPTENRRSELRKQMPSAQAGQDASRSNAGTARPAGFRLNPRFSLWLMGYPAAWASCGERAMQSFQKSRRRS